MKWYVLQVMTGSERDVCTALRRKGVCARAPAQRMEIRRRGQWQTEERLLLPGYPDPWVFIRTYYHAGTRTLYIFDEARGNKLQNDYTARLVKERVAPGELILADLADEKSCADYRSYGLRCWPARKGPGSRELGVRWLQGLNAIVIDPVKCPCVLQEFLEWEYEVAPDGTVLGTLMDANDHGIDAARYACSRIWQRKGA